MVSPICPVRGCGEGLRIDPGGLQCPRRHSFDRARSGYVNLLQPQDRRSRQPGDRPDIVAARARLLAAGHGAAVLRALDRILDMLGLGPSVDVLDVGCGDGWFLAAVTSPRGWAAHGVDLAVAAAELAARRLPQATIVVANADRALPFPNRSFGLVLSIDARRPVQEIHRVLAPDGCLVIAQPAEDDLAELRAAVLGQSVARDRSRRLEADLGGSFERIAVETVRVQAVLGQADLRDALSATYRGARHREQERLAAIPELLVTSSHVVSAWRPLDLGPGNSQRQFTESAQEQERP